MFDRRSFLAATAAVPLAGCMSRVAGGGGRRLRVATYNIWHDRDWDKRRDLAIAALRSADADVIALQEVLQDAATNLPNQAETFAAGLGSDYSVRFFSTSPAGEPRRYGNAILSRLPVIDAADRKLLPLDDWRTAVRTRVDVGGRAVDIVGTHLANQPEAGAVRAQQLDDLLGWVPNDGTPLVVMGDYNAPLEDAPIARMLASRFETALPRGAAPTTLTTALGHSSRVIDHILYERAAFTASDARLFGDQPVGDVWPSDHFGVAATLTLV